MPTLAEVQAEIQGQRQAGATYAEIAAWFGGINRGVIWRIEHQGYEPKDNCTRRALGLSEVVTQQVERNARGRFTKRNQTRP